MQAGQRRLLIFTLFVFTFSCLVGQTAADNMTIAIHDDFWQCDRIDCPLESEQCVIQKSVDAEKLVRRNLCLSSKSEKLADQTFSETATERDVNLLIISTKESSVIIRGPEFNTPIENFEQNLELMNKSSERMREIKQLVLNMPVYFDLNNTLQQSYLT